MFASCQLHWENESPPSSPSEAGHGGHLQLFVTDTRLACNAEEEAAASRVFNIPHLKK